MFDIIIIIISSIHSTIPPYVSVERGNGNIALFFSSYVFCTKVYGILMILIFIPLYIPLWSSGTHKYTQSLRLRKHLKHIFHTSVVVTKTVWEKETELSVLHGNT